MKKKDHSGALSSIGYYYQGCYALVVLLDCDDDRASISVETRDDLELKANSIISLKQLKHKPGSRINLKSDDIWQTIAIWCQYINEDHTHFHFVSTGIIDQDNLLTKLIRLPNNHLLPKETVEEITTAFRIEAERVKSERIKRKKLKKEPIYKKRWPGCKAFLSLGTDNQKKLINRIRITPREFQATDIQHEVEKRLKIVPPSIRSRVAERLIEWWDRLIVLGLLGQKKRTVENSELMEMTARFIADFEENRLIDDFSDIPIPKKILAPSNMVLQIQWVNAGEIWINRAKEARWLARGQRDRWLKDGLFAINKLKKFDSNLEKEWKYRFEDSQEEYTTGKKEPEKAGFDLLNWSFYYAPKDVPPIQKDWQSAYLVRGTYQDMANTFKVGWHPNYESLSRKIDNGTNETDD